MLKIGVACAASCAVFLSACTQPAAMAQYKGQNFYGKETNSLAFNSNGNSYRVSDAANSAPVYIPPSGEPARIESTASVSSVSVSELAPPTPVASAPLAPLNTASSGTPPMAVSPFKPSAPAPAPVMASRSLTAPAAAPFKSPTPAAAPVMASRELSAPTPTTFVRPVSVYNDHASTTAKTEERADIVVPSKAPAAAVSALAATPSPVRFIWPVEGGKVISAYGPKKGGEYNDGINIAADEGEPIWAAADGQVVYAGNELQGYGNMVIIKHDSGWMTAYAHTKSIDVKKNDRVKQGDMIAYVGTSGGMKSAQLHFGMRNGKDPVNPEVYLPKEVASR